ncbi:MAG: hypothetical protein A3A27_00270 [Candidatus Wildermuthbacteria bacterium RIFCSPLOWO2_01_FULL_47_18]|uniref:Uncharacterized protein n=1 Tax=Candidatus Wildermuthbacteria bacterium RIFCSPLOWO2_01_FULL_47_18 TaxID=1802460 RepID=A0A1G2RIZ3_9BACT|nr:MAG: hypothetical protein A3A27_00270 [Candidatus Wildermuthbacteria bacterium RIFCSPLOWO2_01_FULL_47_18]
MNKQLQITIVAIAILVGGYFYLSSGPAFDLLSSSSEEKMPSHVLSEALAARFDYLSKNGNSSCSASFRSSIPSMADDDRLQGSCCSPMSVHRYSEQVEGLVKFKAVAGQNIEKIPDDPYDVEAGLAKELMSYYDLELTPEEQKAYDYAMQNSSEKGPCCCKCWRWYVYGGLGKYLIKNHGFTGEQVTQVWDLSDGCGGASEHHH